MKTALVGLLMAAVAAGAQAQVWESVFWQTEGPQVGIVPAGTVMADLGLQDAGGAWHVVFTCAGFPSAVPAKVRVTPPAGTGAYWFELYTRSGLVMRKQTLAHAPFGNDGHDVESIVIGPDEGLRIRAAQDLQGVFNCSIWATRVPS